MTEEEKEFLKFVEKENQESVDTVNSNSIKSKEAYIKFKKAIR
jgi:hypothetical protein